MKSLIDWDPNEVIYQYMWEEELCPYSEYIFDKDAMKKTYYNEDILRGLEEWGEVREKRSKGEISDQEYIEWKSNYNLYN